MIKSKNPERDIQIVADRVAGLEYGEIAAKHGLTFNRVRGIIRDAVDRGEVTREAARLKRHARIQEVRKPLFNRMMEKVRINETTGCWEYQGGKEGKLGYGSVYVRRGLMISAHRAMYQLAHKVELGRWGSEAGLDSSGLSDSRPWRGSLRWLRNDHR